MTEEEIRPKRSGRGGFNLSESIYTSVVNLYKISGMKKVNNEGKKAVLEMKPAPNNPRNSEGGFAELRDGRILFIYTHFAGSAPDDNAPAGLAKRYSSDGGDTWSNEEIIIEGEGGLNVMSVSLLKLQHGQLALFYLKKNSLWNTRPVMRISEDDGETWSEPFTCIPAKEGYFVLNNDRVILLEKGRLLMPVSLHQTPGTKWSNGGRLWSYFSDDNGRTWQSGGEVPNPENVVLQEPGVVELSKHLIMMFIRTDTGVQYFSFSEDNGETWSRARASKIPSPLSAASIKRIPATGHLLLIWNNNGGENASIAGKRTPFNSAISRDEGKTWQNIRTIEDEPDGWYSYTAIHFIEGAVLLAYCAGKQSNFDIERSMELGTGLSITKITKLSIEWIYGGK